MDFHSALRLMSSYLSDRQQYIDLSGVTSELKGVGVGVPQGSVLGPLLFLIYVNDLPRSTELLNAVLFADDTNLLSSFTSFTSNNKIDFRAINKELDNVYNWLSANKLSLNVSKTKYMIFDNKLDHSTPKISENFEINNMKLKPVKQFDFLGITIDSDLSWKPHATKVCGKISRTLGIMKKIKRFAPPEVMKTLYQSLILPHLSYGIKAWGFAHKNVFNIQKKAVRIMANKNFN